MPRLNIIKDLYSRTLPTIRHHANKINGSIVWKEKRHWKKAWEFEMDRATLKQTWEDVEEEEYTVSDTADLVSSFKKQIPKGVKPIKSKFVFRKTIRPNGTIKYRVRLVACGYSQILGKDFDETYAPTAKYRSLCMILNLAAIFDWEIEGIDVEQAFLESPLNKDIYMTLPKDVYCQSDKPNKPAIVKLLRSLYGLKQAGELWYKTVKEILTDFNYTCLIHDSGVFIKRNPDTGKVIIVVVYVDDILFIGKGKDEIQKILTHVESRVTAVTTMGEVTRYIGVEISRDRVNHTISLSQPYIDKIVQSNEVHDKSAKPIPMQPQADYNSPGDGTNLPIQKQVGEFRFLADRHPSCCRDIGI
jgi:hypothetical protein